MQILKELSVVVDEWLDKLLPGEDEKPVSIHKAMRYSVFAGGKRLRPALCILAYRFAGGSDDDLIFPPACALELIHTYSLIHDDLPAMDNDDLRRGRPTCHKVFGEAIAILAGDSLSAHAFTLLSKGGTMDVITEVAYNIGTYGLVGGQVVDIESEGKDITPEELLYIHRNKTAALIRTSLKVGAMVAEAQSQIIRSLDEYGENIGMAFQIVDDILDIKGTEEQLGKPIGSDDKKNKATYPRLFGLDESYKMAKLHTDKAKEAIAHFDDSEVFVELADFILERAY